MRKGVGGKDVEMLDSGLILRAAVAGTVLQLILAIAGHFSPWVALHLFMFGRMMCSATAGYLYGLWFGRGYAVGALGGAIAGGLCVVPPLALSVLLGDSPAAMVSIGTGISILTGGVGGVFGQIGAFFGKLGR
ncbi:MAG TPA: hypothetical protein VMU01_08630, partial [Rhizomicrobium sp.]|nr:hypothetical protein [Rhizomicrobium sp.]